MGQPMYTVSVDIGGTFTDVVVFDEANGRTVVGKSLTTPGDLRKASSMASSRLLTTSMFR